MIIMCLRCPHNTRVSEEDPDASQQDAFEHAQRRHPEANPLEIMEVKP